MGVNRADKVRSLRRLLLHLSQLLLACLCLCCR